MSKVHVGDHNPVHDTGCLCFSRVRKFHTQTNSHFEHLGPRQIVKEGLSSMSNVADVVFVSEVSRVGTPRTAPVCMPPIYEAPEKNQVTQSAQSKPTP